MKDRGDASILVGWDKPASNTSKILDYTITWPGGATATVPGNQLSYTAIGLDNNSVFPAMFQAAMQGFPTPPAGPRRVDIQVGR